jgi:hypothetical protein
MARGVTTDGWQRQGSHGFAGTDACGYMGDELKEIAEDIFDARYTTIKRRWAMAKAFLHRELSR